MSNQAIGLALGICIGLAAGLTAGYAGFGNGEPEPDGLAGDLGGGAALEPGGGPGEPAPLAATASPNAGTAAGSTPAGGGTPETEPGSTSEAGAPALPSLPAAPARTGNGTITARVTSDAGKPVRGVVVELIETRAAAGPGSTWRRGDPAPGQASGGEPPNLFLRRVSGADGLVSFERLPEGSSYALAAFLQGYDVRNASAPRRNTTGYYSRHGRWIQSTTTPPGNQATVALGAHLELVVLPVVNIPVQLKLPGGGSPPKAVLQVKSVRGVERQSWTPATAGLRLTPGVYRLSATVGERATPKFGEPEYRSAEVALVVPEQGEAEPVTLEVSPRAGIQGRLTGLAAGQNTYSYIWAAPVKDGKTPDAKTLQRSSHRKWARASQPLFVFRDLEPGVWALGVTAQGKSQVEKIVTVTVDSGMATVEIAVPESAGGIEQTVRVLSPDGATLGDVTIQIRYANNSNLMAPVKRTRTADGGHRVTWPAYIQTYIEKSKQPIKLELAVSSPRYGATNTPLTLDQDMVEVRFAEPALLEVTVAGYAGSGYEGRLGVLVTGPGTAGGNVSRWNRGRRSNLQGTLDAEGRYLFGPASPGKVSVQLTIQPTAEQRSKGMQQSRGKAQTVELAPGTNRVTLALPQLHGVTVSVPGARPGHKVSLTSADNTGFRSPEKDCSSGQAGFSGLPAGRYWVYVWNENTEDDGAGDPTVGNMIADVPGSGVIQFRRVPEDAAYVSLWDEEESPLAKAGFKEGDQIIEVGGQPFDGHRQFVKLVSGHKAGKITFTVIREDKSTAKVPFDRDLLIAGLTDDGDSIQGEIYVQQRDE